MPECLLHAPSLRLEGTVEGCYTYEGVCIVASVYRIYSKNISVNPIMKFCMLGIMHIPLGCVLANDDDVC